MKRILFIVLLAVVSGAWYLALPPRARVLPEPAAGFPAAVRGSIHVHTDRSDGTGSVDEVAAAAARAGLAFVVLTDHGDATRLPDPPAYLHGVLVIDAVEISTNHGHVVALGLPQSPYPLGGASRDVVEDIVRMGGMAIAAHPGSPKDQLQWPDWEAPIGGLEWLNGDSEWRDEHMLELTRLLFGYPFRRAESLALALDRPDALLTKWDELTRDRRIVGVAASDAHARLFGVEQLEDSYGSAAVVRIPWYEHVFRAFGIAVTGIALTRDAPRDAESIVAAIRAGHVYSTVDALGTPVALSFSASSGEGQSSRSTATQGDVLPLSGPVHLRAAISAAPGTRIVLFRDGRAMASSAGAVLEHDAPAEPGVYRVEVRWPDGDGPRVPWIVSNPIYVGRANGVKPAPALTRANGLSRSVYADGETGDWRVEQSARAAGALDRVRTASGGFELGVRYALGGARSDSPFVALATPLTGVADYERIVFTGRALQPMRISVQVRAPGGTDGARWTRSVYLDDAPRDISIAIKEMRPSGDAPQPPPTGADLDTLMFVVDTTNTKLGASGQFWIDEIKLVK